MWRVAEPAKTAERVVLRGLGMGVIAVPLHLDSHDRTPMTDTPRKKPQDLRSQQWFGRQDRDGFAYRSWLKGKGIPQDQFDGRPVVGICNTYSELNPCNSHFRTIAEQVKIGVYEAGGFPLEFPVMSLGEVLLRPTAMLYRNLASMDVEESISATRSTAWCC